MWGIRENPGRSATATLNRAGRADNLRQCRGIGKRAIMDSYELNKVAGAVLVAGIIAMVIGLLGDSLVPKPAIAPGSGTAARAPAGAPPPTAAAFEPVTALLAKASVAEGAKAAKKCAACHTFDQGGPNRVGPNLYDIVGAKAAQRAGFAYSKPMAGMSDAWTYETLDKFLFKPTATVPGTKMAFAGLSKTQERADLIAYLRSLSASPKPLP
jgi:cytochrome c